MISNPDEDARNEMVVALSGEALRECTIICTRTMTLPLNAEHLKWIAEIRPYHHLSGY